MRLGPEMQVFQGVARTRLDCRRRLLESFVWDRVGKQEKKKTNVVQERTKQVESGRIRS